MATPTIPNGEEYFFPIIYEGNGAGQRVGKFVPFTDNGTIANSVIYNRSDSPKLARTPSSDGNRKTFTISVWYKPTDLGTDRTIISADTSASGTGYAQFKLDSNNKLWFYSGTAGGGDVISTRTFEDSSKFYHFMAVVDTTQSTASNRVKFYVDGDLITSLDSASYPSQDGDLNFNSTSYPMAVGSFNSLTSLCAGGNLAEFNFVDGQALTPASFGVTDSSTMRWIPKTVSPFPTTTTTFTVTVSNPGSGNVYYIDSSQQATVTLIEGATYRFDQSDSSNSGHPLRFSTTSDGTHNSGTEFTSGVTTVGTPGSSGAYTEITVPTGTATLYYYCTNHSGMGGTANTQDQYGTNGFRLEFGDSSALGDDTSGNTNDFTATNLASTDQTTDSPTQNFATFSPSFSSSSMLLSEGNLTVTDNANANYESAYVGMPVQSGKYYFEITIDVNPSFLFLGVNNLSSVTANKNQYPGYADGSASFLFHTSADYVYYGNNGGNYYQPGSSTTLANGDKLGVAYDADTGAFWIAKNNSWLYSGNPSTGASPLFTGYTPNELVYFSTASWYSTVKQSYNFGQRSFAYTPPTGFVALQQDNLPSTDKGVSGLCWIKDRDSASHFNTLYDSSRGAMEEIYSNSTAQQATQNNGLHKFLKGGFQTGDAVNTNTSGNSFVSWNWVANGGTTASNTDGSITSTVQANTTAGFSICRWTAPASSGKFGHGLSQAPEWILGKDMGRTTGWFVYHKDVGAGKLFYLNSNTAPSSNTTVYSTAPTSTVVDPGTGLTSGSSYGEQVYYCWHSVDGFSKFGSYTGNGNADGPFIYTGFRPAWLMIKRTDASSQWFMFDNKRNTFNPVDKNLRANQTNAESTTTALDFLSNGFKIRHNASVISINENGGNFIYMAVAEHPFQDGTSPVTAR